MIFDELINRNFYVAISNKFLTALDYLKNTDFSSISIGRYEIDNDNIFALVQEYSTISRNQGKWECHKKYIDIQYVAEGIEQIGINSAKNMDIIADYNPEKDIAILSGSGDYITIPKGFFVILFPDEAHQPKIAIENESGSVKKVVVKIKI